MAQAPPPPPPDDPSDATMTLPPPRKAAQAGPGASLLIVGIGSSSRCPLPPSGEVFIGRAADADVCLPHPSVSRRHARLAISPAGDITVEDLRSRNGTAINGAPLAAPRRLLPGDALGVGEFTLLLHRDAPQQQRALIEPAALRQRLEQEITRALYAGRPLSLLCLDLPDPAAAAAGFALPALRPVDAACSFEERQLLCLLPELGAADALLLWQRPLTRLCAHFPQARGGVASCPGDGMDADVLITTARAAAAAAAPGEIAGSDRLVTRLSISLPSGEREIILADPAMRRLYALLERLGKSDLPVLLCGETGTGKELAAAALRHFSPRRDAPLVALNCAALPENLLESMLFGHVKGAFTGATANKVGLLEAAGRGTVFLDEVGEMPLPFQAKLLRVLESRCFTPLGDVRERRLEARLVSATNRQLEEEVRAGRFRNDLLFRLGAARVVLPPLRQRQRELPVLARALLDAARAQAGLPPLLLSDAAMGRLLRHPWPGNVRELKNAMDYAASICEEVEVQPWHLPDSIEALPPEPEGDGAPPAAARRFRLLSEEVRALEATRMREALEAAGGVHRIAAELIGMPKRTFAAKFRLYQLGERR